VSPVINLPKHPLMLACFGLPSLAPATTLVSRMKTEEARSLFGGVAAHSFSPLTRFMSSAIGMALTVAGHSQGWPVARGGSRAITDAMASVIEGSGGRIETGRRVIAIRSGPTLMCRMVSMATRLKQC
jgi:phytoene dehydrogenase-like protein